MKTASSLLINEPALQVLPSLAVKLGLNEAIVLQQVQYWINGNQARGTGLFEGRYWTYNTMKEWQKQFPWWSEKTIQRAIFKLESMGVLLSRINKPGSYDHTKTYTIDYDKLDEAICPDQTGQVDLNDMDNLTLSEETKSPDHLTETTSETTTEIKKENPRVPRAPKIDPSKEKEANPEQRIMFGELAKICRVDQKLKAGQIGKSVKLLIAAGYTTADITKFIEWWNDHDWRGQRGEPPTMPQVIDNIFKAKHWQPVNKEPIYAESY